MASFWNNCKFYTGKFSLLLLMIFDFVEDLQNRREGEQLTDLNNGFGPITKARNKGKMLIIFAEFCVIVVCFLLMTSFQMFTYAVIFSWSDFYMFVGILFSIILSEFIRRCCLLAEEINHVEERYLGSYGEAFKACIDPEGCMEIGFVGILCAAVTINGWKNGEMSLYPVGIYIVASLCVMTFIDLLKVRRISDVEISDMNEGGTNSVSAGLAWSFYFGYLRIVLPEFHNSFRRARGEGYKVDNRDICDQVMQKNKRLFIIIPIDGYCYQDFDYFDDRITLIRQMPAQLRSRGGMHERNYSNSLYRIEKEGCAPKYIVMEYATPVLSMYDMSQFDQANFTDNDRRKQVVEFYKTLKMILSQDPECYGRAKLILIGAGATGDFGGKKLADIIWSHLD